jgi:hypothetical protein
MQQDVRRVLPRVALIVAGATLAVSLTMPSPAAAQQSASPTDTARGLSMLFADGRRVTRPLTASSQAATTGFPTVPGRDTSRDGAPLIGYRVAHVMEGGDALVTVSIQFGPPRKELIKVATIRLSGDRAVSMDELRTFGVEPITFSLVPIAATAAPAPVGVSVSPHVDVRAEPIGANSSAYRVTVTNRSDLALTWFQFQTYRGQQLAMTTRKRGSRNLPVIAPHSEYTFQYTSTASTRAPDGADLWEPHDRVEVSSVLWQDGMVEGALEPAIQQARFDTSRATAVRLLLSRLEGEPSIARLRPEIARSMNFDPDTRQYRDGLLADLDALERTQRSRDGKTLAAWLVATTTECQQWLARIVFPKS